MALYKHSFKGALPAGDIFVFSWWSSSGLALTDTHNNAVNWLANLMAGTGGAPGIAGYMTAGVIMQQIRTALVDPVTGRQSALAESDITTPGTNVNNSLPQTMSVVCSLRSLLATKQGRGRFYLPCPAVNEVTSAGELVSGTQTGYVNSLLQAWTVATTAGEVPVVYSRTSRGTVLVNRFGVGQVLNIQSRRVNKITVDRDFAAMP